MRTHSVSTEDGVRLHVEETGRPSGPSILFIHGFSHCSLTWRRQMESALADEFRLAAMDIRGHGLSDKPADAYADGKLWAGDVHAVIQALELERPVLVGWSYAGFIICDYLRYYGEHDIGGINFVGAATKVSQETAAEVLGGDFLALLSGFFSTDVDESMQALQKFIEIGSRSEPSVADRYLALGYLASVPPGVRQGLLSRTINNDDLLPKLRCPTLITQGERDRIVHAAVAEEHARVIPGARLSMYVDAGHAAFLDDSERFNRELAEFALACVGRTAARA